MDQVLDSICVYLDSRICHQMIRGLELSVTSPSGEKRELILNSINNGQKFNQIDYFKPSVKSHVHWIQWALEGW